MPLFTGAGMLLLRACIKPAVVIMPFLGAGYSVISVITGAIKWIVMAGTNSVFAPIAVRG